MTSILSNTQLQQIKQVFKEVLNEKMTWKIKEKLTNIDNNLEELFQISTTSLKRMRDFNSKYTTYTK